MPGVYMPTACMYKFLKHETIQNLSYRLTLKCLTFVQNWNYLYFNKTNNTIQSELICIVFQIACFLHPFLNIFLSHFKKKPNIELHCQHVFSKFLIYPFLQLNFSPNLCEMLALWLRCGVVGTDDLYTL